MAQEQEPTQQQLPHLTFPSPAMRQHHVLPAPSATMPARTGRPQSSFMKQLRRVPTSGDVESTFTATDPRSNRPNTLRRMFSTTMSLARSRRNTTSVAQEPVNEEPTYRPSTSGGNMWERRLRSIANTMHSRRLSRPTLDTEFVNTDNHMPGNGSAPPVISANSSSGSIAQASATAHNEYLGQLEKSAILRPHLQHLYDPDGDRESGVGIVVSSTQESDLVAALESLPVSRIDFVAQFPPELAIHILANLDAQSLARAMQVSKTWQQRVKNNHVWRESYNREWSQGYATSAPLEEGDGHGMPPPALGLDWCRVSRARQQLQQNWSAGRASHIYLLGHVDSIYCVQFDEDKIITGSRDKTIRTWDIRTLECTLVIGPQSKINNPFLLRDERGEPRHRTPHTDRGYMPETRSFSISHDASILCLQYDDEILVTGSSDGTAIVHSIKDGYRPIMRLQHHTAAILDLAFDSRYIVTCSKDITICIWSRTTGGLIKQLRGHEGPVNAVQMRGNTIVSCSGDFSVKLWNIETGKCIREFIGHTKGLACSQFSDDARYIASAGNDKAIRIWDAHTGECLRIIEAHDNLVRSLHVCSVSGRLISGSYDQDIKVFDMASGRLLLDFPKWHQSWVLGAKSDYRRIISTGQDPKVLIMDFGQGVEDVELLEGRSGRYDPFVAT